MRAKRKAERAGDAIALCQSGCRRTGIIALIILALLPLACCDEDKGTTPDTTPPAAVTDLSVAAVTDTSATLTWLAPGDDGTTGRATGYDVRWSTALITEATWDAASEVADPPEPQAAGSAESLMIANLAPATVYHVALKTEDESHNWSALSNVASDTTAARTQPVLAVSPDGLDFGDAHIQLALAITNTGTGTLTWTVTVDRTWLNATPTAGTTTTEEDEVTVTVDRTSLSPGSYSGTVTVTPEGAEPREVAVAMNISETPVLAVNPVTLHFANDESVKFFTITNEGRGTLTWSVADDQAWLTVSPAGGSTTTEEDQVTVGIDRLGLGAGSYSGVVTVTPEGGTALYVNLTLDASGEPTPGSMVLVPAGSFRMGDGRADCGLDEHQVTLTHSFYLGQYEVTNQEYRDAVQWAYDHGYVTVTASAVLDNLDGSSLLLVDLADLDCQISFSSGEFAVEEGKGNHPVVEVTWWGAVAYCDWLSLRAGLARAYDHDTWQCNAGDPYGAAGYRLPTDAEWEYATQYEGERNYPWGNQGVTCSRANYGYCVGSTTPVGSYPAAPAVLALYDMAGNVWEWCDDRHVCNLGTEAVTDPGGPASGSSHVVRGGAGYAIYYNYYVMHCANRSYLHPAATSDYLGFRYVRSQ